MLRQRRLQVSNPNTGSSRSSGGSRSSGATFAGEYLHFDEVNTQSSTEHDIHRYGDSHPEIRQVQVQLNRTDCKLAETGPGSPGNETDYFGPRTRDAHLCFQSAVGLNQTGHFDPPTRHALFGVPDNERETPAAKTVRERSAYLRRHLTALLGQLRDKLREVSGADAE